MIDNYIRTRSLRSENCSRFDIYDFYSLFPEDACLVVEELVISNQRKGVKDCKLYIDALILLLL